MEKKRKIGIATFYTEKNYGAVLQSYALQEAIKSCDCDVEFLQYHETIDHAKFEHKSKVRSIINFLFTRFSFLWDIKAKVSLYKRLQKAEICRNRLFKRFQYDYMNVSPYPLYDLRDASRISNLYDAFVAGSDMVWTPMGQNLDFYFLVFTEKQKRLSYAPSMTGVDSFSSEINDKMREYLSNMGSLCFREREAVEYAERLIGTKATQVLDPTFLLRKEEWAEKFGLREDGEHYILCYLFGDVSSQTRKNIHCFSEYHNLPVRYISLHYKDVFYEQYKGYTGAYGPKEFVELFYNANFIITNTFHGFAFSLIMQKPFVVLHRERNNRWAKNEGRISHILNDINCIQRYIHPNEPIDFNYIKIDFKCINEVLECKREQSKAYLNSMLGGVALSKNDSEYKNIGHLSERQCTGCLACVERCAKKCIRIGENSEGFAIPIVDNSSCVNCSACVGVCPAISGNAKQDMIEKSFSAFATTGNIDDSASGGVFITLARHFIKSYQGIVVGCIFDEHMKCKHVLAKTESELFPMQNSKYVQSDVSKVYKDVNALLNQGYKILFTGTPCQVSAIKKITRNNDNLYTVDLICHGVPSPKLWGKYLDSYKQPILGYKFRDRNKKKNGNSSFYSQIKFLNNKKEKHFSDDFYYSSFLRGENYRESCYYCRYANLQREGDLTIGDCDSWDYSKHDFQGELRSFISINNKNGQILFNLIEEDLHFDSIKIEDEAFVNETLNHPTVRPAVRSYYYEDMNHMEWHKFVRKYNHKSLTLICKKGLISLLSVFK